MKRAGIVAALAAEARAFSAKLPRPGSFVRLADDSALLTVSGVGLDAAGAAAQILIGAGVAGLISFGLAGGLDPALPAGSLLLADEVQATHERSRLADAAWRQRVQRSLGSNQPVAGGKLWTSRVPVLTVDAKSALFAASGCAAVDMEAMAVARAAAAASLPFLAVKVIVDTAGDALPSAVLAVDRSGRVRSGRLALTLLQRPGEIAALVRLGRRFRAAHRTLRTVAASGPLRQPPAEE